MADAKTEKQKVKEITDKLDGYAVLSAEIRQDFKQQKRLKFRNATQSSRKIGNVILTCL